MPKYPKYPTPFLRLKGPQEAMALKYVLAVIADDYAKDELGGDVVMLEANKAGEIILRRAKEGEVDE